MVNFLRRTKTWIGSETALNLLILLRLDKSLVDLTQHMILSFGHKIIMHGRQDLSCILGGKCETNFTLFASKD